MWTSRWVRARAGGVRGVSPLLLSFHAAPGTAAVPCTGCFQAQCCLQGLLGPWGAAAPWHFRNHLLNTLPLRAWDTRHVWPSEPILHLSQHLRHAQMAVSAGCFQGWREWRRQAPLLETGPEGSVAGQPELRGAQNRASRWHPTACPGLPIFLKPLGGSGRGDIQSGPFLRYRV